MQYKMSFSSTIQEAPQKFIRSFSLALAFSCSRVCRFFLFWIQMLYDYNADDVERTQPKVIPRLTQSGEEIFNIVSGGEEYIYIYDMNTRLSRLDSGKKLFLPKYGLSDLPIKFRLYYQSPSKDITKILKVILNELC